MTLEKRGNSEVEVKSVAGELMMILPGSNVAVKYDGRFDAEGLTKTSSLKENESTFFEL